MSRANLSDENQYVKALKRKLKEARDLAEERRAEIISLECAVKGANLRANFFLAKWREERKQ